MAWEGAGMTAPINQEGNMTMEDSRLRGNDVVRVRE